MYATESIEHLRLFMTAVEQQIARLGLVKRGNHQRYPFDHVADETLSKVFALIRSVVLLVENGQPEEAYGLARSIVECALNLRWITKDRSGVFTMATQFVNFTKHERSLWLWWIEHSQTTAPEQKDDASRVAAEFGLTADAKAAYAHWSGKGQFAYKASVQTVHPADDANFSSEQKAMKQVVDYFGPSCYVHCSQPALDVYFSDDPEFRIHRPKAGKRDVGDSAIFICHHYLHDILTYCFYGMNVTLPDWFDCLQRHSFDPAAEGFRYKSD